MDEIAPDQTPHALADPVDDTVSPHRPVRTCVGCRAKGERSALVRVVACEATAGAGSSRARVVVDEQRRLPGRGAWLHPDPTCLDLAVRRRALPRALRVTGAELDDVLAWFERQVASE